MNNKEKCVTCMLRYVCQEQSEYYCKHDNYKDYIEDSSVLKGNNYESF